MRRVTALSAGFAITLALGAFASFAAEPAQAPAASAQAPAGQASAPAKPAPASSASDNSDLSKMVPPAGPGVFMVQKKGKSLHLVVTGHKFTSREEIEKYLAYRAAEQTLAQKGTWFTFVQARTKGDTVPVPKRDPKGPHFAFHMENWQPVWRYKMKGDTAWKSWSPFQGVAFFADGKDPKTITDFEVSADIVVHNGPSDDLNPLAFEAAPLSDLLISQVSPPQ